VKGDGRGGGVGVDAGGLQGGSRVGFDGEGSSKLTTAHALEALVAATEGFLKGGAEESNFASGSNLVKNRTGTTDVGGSAGSLKGGAEEVIAPRDIGDPFVELVAARGAVGPILNGAEESAAAKALEIDGGVVVLDATGGAASDHASTQFVSNGTKGRELIPSDGCSDDPSFEYIKKKKNGDVKSLGGCKFVSRKKKNRCKRLIKGVRVRRSCARTCSRCDAPPPPTLPKSIEGTYFYRGCEGTIFEATITCGEFPTRSDLCRYEEFAIGSLSAELTEGATLVENELYFVPISLPSNFMFDEDDFEQDRVCSRAGVFSTSMAKGKTSFSLPLPLASNGCKVAAKAFELFLKIDVAVEGNLDLSFSIDKGLTFYTDNSCSASYVAEKVDERRRLDFFDLVGDFVEQLREQNEDASAPCDSCAARFPLGSSIESAFNNELFDSSKVDDRDYMSRLNTRCNTAIIRGDLTVGALFGCNLYFELSLSNHKFAMGPLKVGADLLNSNNPLGYRYNTDFQTYTQIFTPNALAIMINEGCFQFQPGSGQRKEEYRYSSSLEMSDTYEDSNSQSFSIEGGYAGVSISAAAERSRSTISETKRNVQYYHAKKSWVSDIGTVDNKCFSDSQYGTTSMEVIVENNLVRPEYVRAWREVRGLQLLQYPNDSLSILERYVFQNAAFKLVAEAGIFIPQVYMYGVEVNYRMSGSFVQTTVNNTKTISNSLSAGISYQIPESVSASFSLTNAVSHTVNTAMSSSEEEVTVNAEKRGVGVSVGCLNDNTCGDDVENAAEIIRADVSRLGEPLSANSYLSMDSFVKNYFAAEGEIATFDDGFPNGFKNALMYYYSYEKCLAVANRSCGCRFLSTCGTNRGSYVGTFRGDGVFDGLSFQYCDGDCTASTRFKYIDADQREPDLCPTTPTRRYGPIRGDPTYVYRQDEGDYYLKLVDPCSVGVGVGNLNNIGDDPDQMLVQCEGDCDNDSMCEGNLICFNRDEGEPVPGCTGVPYRWYDYCIDP